MMVAPCMPVATAALRLSVSVTRLGEVAHCSPAEQWACLAIDQKELP